jgi:DNA-binding HxlR family transcriptional regulator
MRKAHSTNTINHRFLLKECALNYALDIIRGRWKTLILGHIANGVNRFSLLKTCMPGISDQVLGKQLRELEEAGIIVKQVFAEVPPRTEYSFTGKGRALMVILEQLTQWGDLYEAPVHTGDTA